MTELIYGKDSRDWARPPPAVAREVNPGRRIKAQVGRRVLTYVAHMFGKKKPEGPGKPAGGQKPAAKSWHAVSVVAGKWPCAEVKKLGQRRFLANEAPRLPLSGCDWTWRCQCVYRHFADRRAGPRRTMERDGLPGTWYGSERRQGYGRRSTDGATS